MARSVSFLRRITFKSPSSHTPIWIKQADLYEDENRIYAFLTFENQEKSPMERVKIRITPFDEGKYGMDPFGIQILNLGLKPGASKEHPDPLILPKGTYGFNFSIVSYGLKRKALDVNAAAPVDAPAPQDKAVSISAEESNEPAQEAPSGELGPNAPEQVAPKAKKEPVVKNPNRVRPLGKMPALAIALLILLGVAAGFLLLMSGVWGKNIKI